MEKIIVTRETSITEVNKKIQKMETKGFSLVTPLSMDGTYYILTFKKDNTEDIMNNLMSKLTNLNLKENK